MDNNGIFYKNNKITYKGNWKNGQKHGKGQSYYKNWKYQYKGEWKEKKRNGNGKSFYKNGRLQYIGEWEKDEIEGFGRLYYNTEDNVFKVLDIGKTLIMMVKELFTCKKIEPLIFTEFGTYQNPFPS